MIDETRFRDRIDVDRPRAAAMARTLAMPEATTTIEYRPVVVRRASWGAIFAGMFAAMAIQALLTVLGLAIGLSVLSPTDSSPGTQTIGIGAGIWWVMTGVISLFIGGWIAGRLAGIPRFVDATLHGIAMWAATTVLSALLVSTVSSALLGGALGALSVHSTNNQTDLSGNRSANTPGSSIPAANDRAPQSEGERPGSLNGPDIDAQARGEDDGVAQTSASGDRSPQDRTEARRTLDEARRGAAGTSWWTFFALLLGVCAAALGGYFATPRDMVSVTVADSRR